MLIYPEIIPTPDAPTIKFNQPLEHVDLGKEIPRILQAQGWGCGTYFNVQFLNHEKTKLLSCGRFVVSEEIETIQTNDANPYQPMTRTVFSRRAEQIGEWWVLPGLLNKLFDEGIGNNVGAVAGEQKHEVTAEPKRRGRPPKEIAA